MFEFIPQVQCKVTSAMYSPETGGEDPGMVADGTKCGEDMVSTYDIGFLFHCRGRIMC